LDQTALSLTIRPDAGYVAMTANGGRAPSENQSREKNQKFEFRHKQHMSLGGGGGSGKVLSLCFKNCDGDWENQPTTGTAGTKF
jgi:hypothetical protein